MKNKLFAQKNEIYNALAPLNSVINTIPYSLLFCSDFWSVTFVSMLLMKLWMETLQYISWRHLYYSSSWMIFFCNPRQRISYLYTCARNHNCIEMKQTFLEVTVLRVYKSKYWRTEANDQSCQLACARKQVLTSVLSKSTFLTRLCQKLTINCFPLTRHWEEFLICDYHTIMTGTKGFNFDFVQRHDFLHHNWFHRFKQ